MGKIAKHVCNTCAIVYNSKILQEKNYVISEWQYQYTMYSNIRITAALLSSIIETLVEQISII